MSPPISSADINPPPSDSPEPVTFNDGRPLPKVVIFDLDYTLWPFWVDTHVTPPFKASTGSANRVIKDRLGETLEFYPQVPGVLAAARRHGIKVAAASRTCAPDDARKLLGLLHVEGEPAKSYFDALEIFPGDKTRHVDGIRKSTGIECEDMAFWDDESRNSNVERQRGVAFQLVRDGVTRDEIDKGIHKWRKMRGV